MKTQVRYGWLSSSFIAFFFSLAYANPFDLISQLLMERLLCFHQTAPPQDLTPPIFVNHGASPTSGSGQVIRYTNQPGRVGMVAYLLDCYDRAVLEERYVKVYIYILLANGWIDRQKTGWIKVAH